jgi:Thioesterase-like superfamily
MATFNDATRVDGSDGTFAADLDPEWTVGGRPHGGYLIAVMGRAAVTAVPDHPHPLSASAVYVASPEVGPATVTVEALRQGRTASQVRTRLVQKQRVCVETLFVTGRLDSGAEERWTDVPPPDVAPLEECRVNGIEVPGTGIRVAMLEMVEQRIDPVSFRGRGRPDGSGDLRGWLSFADGSEFDALSLLYVSDAFPPATFTMGSVGWVPTLELTVYLRALPAPGPLRVRQRARVLTGGFVDQVCEAWDSRGRVVVQATQLAAVRMHGD